ncbi:type VI secretion system lipoprotein TssJ [Erwinia sp. BNK-24-b]|uniref:type VI secretion system lipoprotein TssJ n=1 Tax=unclassified Erwinia TaxID=2622719 RepID=UPI0039BF437F
MMNRNFLRLSFQAFFLMAFSVLTGCTSHSVPTHYSLVFQNSPQVNNGAPLKVRVLLLRSDADFMSADFYSLQNKTSALLGGALLNSEQLFLMPGKGNKTLQGPLPAEARYIGVLAEYQTLDGKKWRLALPLPVGAEKQSVWQQTDNELRASLIANDSGLIAVH